MFDLKKLTNIISTDDEGIPFILAKYRKANNAELYVFYCDYCKKQHTHGAGDGHRAAHCSSEHSGFTRKGYHLVGIKC